MKGNNRLIICSEEMKQAVQHYFKTVVFKPSSCPEVKSIRQASGVEGSFEVDVEDGDNRPSYGR